MNLRQNIRRSGYRYVHHGRKRPDPCAPQLGVINCIITTTSPGSRYGCFPPWISPHCIPWPPHSLTPLSHFNLKYADVRCFRFDLFPNQLRLRPCYFVTMKSLTSSRKLYNSCTLIAFTLASLLQVILDILTSTCIPRAIEAY